jgi:hypothetical protein
MSMFRPRPRLAKKAIAASWLKTMKRQYVLIPGKGTLESHFTTEAEGYQKPRPNPKPS